MKRSGLIVINKPVGLSSFDVIRYLRAKTKINKIGHAGTLDPQASGILICLLGEATKNASLLSNQDKTYLATIFFGSTSLTFDSEGPIKKICENPNLSLKDINNSLQSFVGEFYQTPPVFSAIKINGQRAYKLARKNPSFFLPPRKVCLKYFKIINFSPPELQVSLETSKGFYVRSLASDLGEKLGCGAYLKNLVRTAIGCFNLDSAVDLFKIQEDNWHNYLLTD